MEMSVWCLTSEGDQRRAVAVGERARFSARHAYTPLQGRVSGYALVTRSSKYAIKGKRTTHLLFEEHVQHAHRKAYEEDAAGSLSAGSLGSAAAMQVPLDPCLILMVHSLNHITGSEAIHLWR